MRHWQRLDDLKKEEAREIGVVDAWEDFHEHSEGWRRTLMARLIASPPFSEDPVRIAYSLAYQKTFLRLYSAPLTTPSKLRIATHPKLVEYERVRETEKRMVITDGDHFEDPADMQAHMESVIAERARAEETMRERDQAITERHQEAKAKDREHAARVKDAPHAVAQKKQLAHLKRIAPTGGRTPKYSDTTIRDVFDEYVFRRKHEGVVKLKIDDVMRNITTERAQHPDEYLELSVVQLRRKLTRLAKSDGFKTPTELLKSRWEQTK